MQSDHGKLFIGGISWETNEERLKEYFSTFGEVTEAIIMKDRNTGRARGFGFILFSDPTVADRVTKEKHNIDGRMVEAKKAVPRDDLNISNRNSGGVHGCPGQVRTRKIFVGGLASTVTESDFRKYFEQFGAVTDVVVMYDHNTQRPRGFGFITYDSEEAIDRVLVRTFHELNGKMVEVKRAVPKEPSPSPIHTPLGGYDYGLDRVNNFLTACTQSYSPNPFGGRLNRVASGRSGFPPLGPGSGGQNGNFGGNLGYGRGLNPYYRGNSSDGNGGNASLFSLRNLWENGGLNYGIDSSNFTPLMESGPVNTRGTLGNGNVNWGSSSNNSYYFGRNSGNNGAVISSSYVSPNGGGYKGPFGDLYGGNSIYEDSTLREATRERDGWSSFGYGLGNAALDVAPKGSSGHVGGYGVDRRMSDKGIPS